MQELLQVHLFAHAAARLLDHSLVVPVLFVAAAEAVQEESYVGDAPTLLKVLLDVLEECLSFNFLFLERFHRIEIGDLVYQVEHGVGSLT